MAHLHKRMAFHNDNKFIPKYVPNNLKWYERDDLDTWYLQNKCNDVLMDTDEHFKETNIVNFDIIKNKKLEEEKLKQYQTIDHDEIMKYPGQIQVQICSLTFRNSKRKDMHILKETVNEHFNKNKIVNAGTRRGRFLKKIRDDMYHDFW